MSVTYAMYDALMSIKVPDEKAKAVIDALEREMMDKIATKADLAHAQDSLSRDFRAFDLKLEHVQAAISKDIGAFDLKLAHVQGSLSKDVQSLSTAITLRVILTAVALVPAIVAAQKLF